MPDEATSKVRYYEPDAIERIIRAAGRFPEPSPDDPRDPTERRQELEDALEFAADRFVTAFLARTVRSTESRSRGRPPSTEIQDFVDHLQGIWLDVFGGKFRTSFDGVRGEATGPQVRFGEACFQELRSELSGSLDGNRRPEELAALVEELGMTRNALRHRMQRGQWPKTISQLGDSLAGEFDSDPTGI